MASAGRILIMPKGEWDANKEYEMLDLVKHSGTAWLNKKPCVGIEPSEANKDYWQDMFGINEIVDSIDIEDIGGVPTDKMGSAAYSADLHETYEIPTFVRWDNGTKNTPYSDGLTGCSKGFAIVYGSYSSHHTIAAWTLGGGSINYYVHQVNQGEDIGWGTFVRSELNYDKVSTRTYTNLPFTCPSAGEVIAMLTASSGGSATMSITKNGYENAICNAYAPNSKSNITFQVAKGDVIDYGEGSNIGTGKIVFIPQR